MAKRLGELFMLPLYDNKNTSLKQQSFESSKISKDLSSPFNKINSINMEKLNTNKLNKKQNQNFSDTQSKKTYKTTTTTHNLANTRTDNYDHLSNNDDDDDSEENGAFKLNRGKVRTTLREEIAIKQNFEQTIPGFFTRKNFDLMRIVEDQV